MKWIYTAMIRPIMSYACVYWAGGLNKKYLVRKLIKVQRPEVESSTQGSRPRTAFPRTDNLDDKDRNARGQCQGPRTQPQVFSKKKDLQKSFSGNLQFIGVARIFGWED